MIGNKTGIIIQARTGSTRLPAKMTMPFAGDQCMFDILLQRLIPSVSGIPVILATTSNPNDDVLVRKAESFGIGVYRGSEQDVLGRFIGAAQQFAFDGIIRVCADNPFISLYFLNQLAKHASVEVFDYISYGTASGNPTILTHYGFFAEYVSLSALSRAAGLTENPIFREHVTNYVYRHPEIFNISLVPIPLKLEERPYLRFTVDTKGDFEVAQIVYSQLLSNGLEVEWENVLSIAEQNPALIQTMKNEISRNQK